MRLIFIFLFITCIFFGNSHAQVSVISGRVTNIHSNKAINGAKVSVSNLGLESYTDELGVFSIEYSEVNLGEHTLVIQADGYLIKNFRILMEKGKYLNIDPILMEPNFSISRSEISVIGLSDYELDEVGEVTANYSGLLEASRDVFLNAVAYDFSATFFKPRGLDNRNVQLLINGTSTNKFYDGRPQWGSLGGVNDLQRIREFARNSKNTDFGFGGMAGTNNIVMRASSYSKGGKGSYARANRSYQNRIMCSYRSGITPSGWSYAILASRRSGERGFIEGTPYEANSLFLAVEKSLGSNHSINISAFYTPVERGRGTALTEEVERLKGSTYNPNWGFQEGRLRNSRLRRIEQPLVQLNHFWDLSDSFRINTNLAYQFGEIGNTRLDNAGIRNPAPNYYQRLPSYFLRNPFPDNYDFRLALEAEGDFINDGQLDWESFYNTNANSSDGISRIILQEDVRTENLFVFNSIATAKINEQLSINAKLEFRSLSSDNFAIAKDLMGGSGFRDVDYFGSDPDQIQSDLENPERIVAEGERYKYNYRLNASRLDGFLQAQLRTKRLNFYAAIHGEQTNYQRQGLYRNGYFPEENRSLGLSDRLSFTSFSGKLGGTYSINGRHFTEINMAYSTRPPLLRNAFANPRQNNDLVIGLVNEGIQQADVSYLYRSTILDTRITGYYTSVSNQTDIGFFFTQNALGSEDSNAFVQEIVTGIGLRNVGIEVGAEAQIITSLKIKAAASVGQSIYNTNPELYLSGDDFDTDTADSFVEGNDLSTLGKREVFIENYRVAGGPQEAYQIGLEYRDPSYWWVGGTLNYFTNTFVDISYLRRTSDFYTDKDGLPFNDYDENIARSLLKQERLDDYFLVNLVGGKTWRIRKYTIGLFASVNNLLGTIYRSGGFEDSRRVSYRQRLEEENRPYGPLFGNRYFYGNGTTYFMNIYFRF
jgi:hypothetical protein